MEDFAWRSSSWVLEAILHHPFVPFLSLASCSRCTYRNGRYAVQDSLRTGRLHVENNTVQLLTSQLDADRQWTAHELEADVGVGYVTKLCPTFCMIFWVTANVCSALDTSKADDKRCLLLHVPAAPFSSKAQEKTTTLCTIAPKLVYGRKECDLADLLTPLVIHTLLYSRKWQRSPRKTLKNPPVFSRRCDSVAISTNLKVFIPIISTVLLVIIDK